MVKSYPVLKWNIFKAMIWIPNRYSNGLTNHMAVMDPPWLFKCKCLMIQYSGVDYSDPTVINQCSVMGPFVCSSCSCRTLLQICGQAFFYLMCLLYHYDQLFIGVKLWQILRPGIAIRLNFPLLQLFVYEPIKNYLGLFDICLTGILLFWANMTNNCRSEANYLCF